MPTCIFIKIHPMKKIAFLSLASIVFFACKKEKDDTYTVKFVTTGTDVIQFKVYQGSTVGDKEVPFTGTQDTTMVVPAGTMVKLDSKANSNYLTGAILVNGVQVSSGTDADPDGDGKSQVKLEYLLND
jgi:hypothetical protein